MKKEKRVEQSHKVQTEAHGAAADGAYIYTRAEAAAAIGRSPSVIDKQFRRGRVRRIKTVRQRQETIYLYHKEDIEKLNGDLNGGNGAK